MKGEVVYLYAFDVANEIQTARVREVLAAKPTPIEVYTDHTYPKDVPLYKPLAIEPERPQATMGGQQLKLSAGHHGRPAVETDGANL